MAALFLSACNDDPSAEVAVVAPGERLAWSGETESLKLVLEPLASVQQKGQLALTELQMLRDRFGIEAEVELVRLHMIGAVPNLAEIGMVELAGQQFEAFPAPEAAMSAAQRLVWDGVLRGLPIGVTAESDQPTRRSVILRGPRVDSDFAAEESAQWSSADQSVILDRKVWTEANRRAHFEHALEDPSELDSHE